MKNILECSIPNPPNEVYILATGPNGKEAYSQIPPDAWVIGVNKAILLNEGAAGISIPMWLWLAADITLPEQEWFASRVDIVIGYNFPLESRYDPTPVFSTSPAGLLQLTTRYPNVPYYFKHGVSLVKPPVFTPLPGCLRAGGTISAQAIQLAYWLGAKRIILCGVDMTGDKYFDGSSNLNSSLLADGTSKYLRVMQMLCDWLKGEGVEVFTISDTALDIPRLSK